MPEWLRAVLGSSAFIAAVALAWRALVVSLSARSKAKTERVEAETRQIEAETARLLAEVRVRESQARITEGDAEALRSSLAHALRSSEAQSLEIRAQSVEIRTLRQEQASMRDDLNRLRGQLLYEAQARSIEQEMREQAELALQQAVERETKLRNEFVTYHSEVRAGRPPRHTPSSIARVDTGVPTP